MLTDMEPLIRSIQTLLVKTLELEDRAELVDANWPLSQMRLTRDGQEYGLDSVDLVDVLTQLESELGLDFLEDPAISDLSARGTIRDFADYLGGRVDAKSISVFVQKWC
jgi:acyl carrier protein